MVATGCGLGAGYAPDAVPVHRGRPARLTERPAPDSLRVVSWNIQYGERLDQALAEIRAHPRLADADLFLLQELDPAGAALLADSLGLHHVYGRASVNPRSGRLFGNAVLSRWPVAGQAAEVLPHGTPLTGHRRVAVSALLDLGPRGRLQAVSVHTATVVVDQRKRLDQAAAVLDSLGAGSVPVLVAGDFNTVSAWEVTLLGRVARRHGFAPVRLPAGPTAGYRLRRLPGEVPVLDHVLYRGLMPGASGVVRSTAASDHFPVWAVFALPPEKDAVTSTNQHTVY